jgi:polyhydroxybutyrate depolymerase
MTHIRPFFAWSVFALLVLLPGCGGDGGRTVTEINPIDAPGTYTREFGLEGLRRSFLLYVPASANLSQPVPIVMVLHGNPPIDMRGMSQMNEQADSLGFVAVYPQSWNRGEWAHACSDCNLPGEQGIDDVAYFRTVIQVLQGDLNVDADRIFISGFSMGGLMTTRLACTIGNQLGAVAIIGSIAWDWHVENCPSPPVPTIWFIGTEDNQFAWEGTPTPIVSQLSGEDFRVAWAAQNGCSTELPAEEPVPDLDPDDGTTAVVYRHEGCTAPFVEYKFEGMDHNWPGSPFPVVPTLHNRDVHASGILTRFFYDNAR